MADTKTEQQPQAQPAPAAGGPLLDEILSEARLKPTREGCGGAKEGVTAFITEMLAPAKAAEQNERAAGDATNAARDRRPSRPPRRPRLPPARHAAGNARAR